MTEEIEAGESAGRDLIGVSVTGSVALDFEKRTGRNVLARLELDGLTKAGGRRSSSAPMSIISAAAKPPAPWRGGDETGEIHHGADDNASGVAALIEVAQKLAADHATRAGSRRTRRRVSPPGRARSSGCSGPRTSSTALAESAGRRTCPAWSRPISTWTWSGGSRRVILSGLGSSDIWAREIERRNAVIGLPIVTSDDTYLPTDATAFYLKGVPILAPSPARTRTITSRATRRTSSTTTACATSPASSRWSPAPACWRKRSPSTSRSRDRRAAAAGA